PLAELRSSPRRTPLAELWSSPRRTPLAKLRSSPRIVAAFFSRRDRACNVRSLPAGEVSPVCAEFSARETDITWSSRRKMVEIEASSYSTAASRLFSAETVVTAAGLPVDVLRAGVVGLPSDLDPETGRTVVAVVFVTFDDSRLDGNCVVVSIRLSRILYASDVADESRYAVPAPTANHRPPGDFIDRLRLSRAESLEL
ncbi:MAG: hypothetical protein FD118_4233, partial [Rhodocyclaceae bacterium]